MAETHIRCTTTNEIDLMKEDLNTIKVALGYKEKYNGKFREEVEEEQHSLCDRLAKVEESTTRMEATLNTAVTSMRWTIGIGFSGIIGTILFLLSLHL